MKRYTCYGGNNKLEHLLGVEGNHLTGETGHIHIKGRPCIYYKRSGCTNEKVLNLSGVPRERCDFYETDCFIATAIFGPTAEETNILRSWRDKSLNTTLIGRLVVKVYYIISPTIVKILERYPILKKSIESGLKNFVKYLKTK